MKHNNISTFDELLKLDGSVLTDHRNLQCLAIELYKIFSGVSPNIMEDVFLIITYSIYDLTNRQTFYTRSVKSVYKGTKILSYNILAYGN